MKPSIVSGDLKDTALAIDASCQPNSQMPSAGHTGHTKGRLVVGIVLAVVVLAVVSATILTAVYLGTRVAEHNFKEAMVTFHQAGSDVKVTEKIVLTDTEEDITVPGKMRIVYDYRNGLMVVQFSDPANDVCYVADFDTSSAASLESDRTEITGNHMNKTVSFDDRRTTLESTGEQVDINTLCPRAREMCFDRTIVRAVETFAEGERQKRGCGVRCSFQCSLFRGCGLVCGFSCSFGR